MSLQAVFKHKANADEGLAPALFAPSGVETFEAKQKIEEREAFAAISNSHGEARVSNSLASGRVVAAQNPETGGSADKKRKEKERFAKAASDLAEWLAEMDEKIEQLRAEVVEHRQRAQELFEEAEELEELADAIKNGDELSESQQRKIAEIRRENPGINDLEIIMLMHEEAERSRAEARIENALAEKKSKDLERDIEIRNEGQQMADVASSTPEAAKPALADDMIEVMNKSPGQAIAAEYARMSIDDVSLQTGLEAGVEELSDEHQEISDNVRENEISSFSLPAVGLS